MKRVRTRSILNTDRTLVNHQEAIVGCAQSRSDFDKLKSGQVADVGLDRAEVVAGIRVVRTAKNAFPTGTGNSLEFRDAGFGSVVELTAGNSVDRVGVLIIHVIADLGQSLDERQITGNNTGGSGSDQGEGSSEEFHSFFVFGWE